MKPLTEREEVMNFFWESGALSVRDVVAFHNELHIFPNNRAGRLLWTKSEECH